MVSSVQRYQFATECFDITGATFQQVWLPINSISRLALSILTTVILLGIPTFYGFFGEIEPLLATILISGCSLAPYNIFRTYYSAARIRLNRSGDVHEIMVAHNSGDNLALEAILARLTPFEERYHQYRPAKFGCFRTDCLMAFPARYIWNHGAVAIGCFLTSAFGFAAVCYANSHEVPPGHLTIYLFQTLGWASLGLLYILKSVWLYRTKRKVPEVQVALRAALGYLRAGEFDRVEPLLREAMAANPDDETLVSLRAQVAVIRGHYDDAERILKTQPASQGFNLEQLQTICELPQEH